MGKHTLQVEIFGAGYSLKSDQEPEHVEKVARFVDRKIAVLSENTKVKSQTKIAVLAALNIADELFTLKAQCANLEKKLSELENKTKDLCQQIDNHISFHSEV